MDFDHKTMKDFAALIVGLPPLSGSRKLEDELKTKIESATKQKVVGVSVGWDFQEKEEEVMAFVMKHNDELEEAYKREKGVVDEPEVEEPERSGFRQKQYEIEMSGIGPADPVDLPDLNTTLEELKNSENGLVVFESEEARDKA